WSGDGPPLFVLREWLQLHRPHHQRLREPDQAPRRTPHRHPIHRTHSLAAIRSSQSGPAIRHRATMFRSLHPADRAARRLRVSKLRGFAADARSDSLLPNRSAVDAGPAQENVTADRADFDRTVHADVRIMRATSKALHIRNSGDVA